MHGCCLPLALKDRYPVRLHYVSQQVPSLVAYIILVQESRESQKHMILSSSLIILTEIYKGALEQVFAAILNLKEVQVIESLFYFVLLLLDEEDFVLLP
jgi:hypothetical protein